MSLSPPQVLGTTEWWKYPISSIVSLPRSRFVLFFSFAEFHSSLSDEMGSWVFSVYRGICMCIPVAFFLYYL